MKRYLLAICVAAPLLSAENLRTLGTEYIDNINNIKKVKGGQKVNDEKGGVEDDYMDSVIWVDIFEKKTHGVPLPFTFSNGIDNPNLLAHPVDKKNEEFAKLEAKALAKQAKLEAQKKEKVSYFAGGYCTMPYSVSISKGREFMKLNCSLNFGSDNYRPASVFTVLYPDYKRERVYAIPLYIDLPSGKRANFSGIVLNETKTSVNVADWVDNARLRKLIGEGVLAANDIAYKYVSGYLQAKQESRTTTQVHYIATQGANGTSTTVPVETKQVKPPKVSDYLIGAGVELLTKLFSLKGKDYLYSSNPLFIVNPKKVYVEGIVNFDNEGLARSFGKISQEQEKTATKNNMEWKQEINKIINTYGNIDNSKNKGK
jgi:hypothetical protein